MHTLLMVVVSIGLIGIERFRFGEVGEFGDKVVVVDASSSG